MDLFDKILQDKGPLGTYSHIDDNYYMFPMLEGEIGPRMLFKGKEVLNWSLNNYLGLANNPEVRKADAEAAKEWGLSYPMGARMMSGNSIYHEKLEKELHYLGLTFNKEYPVILIKLASFLLYHSV